MLLTAGAATSILYHKAAEVDQAPSGLVARAKRFRLHDLLDWIFPNALPGQILPVEIVQRLQPALERCAFLLDLDEDWDRYGAPRISEFPVENALAFLEEILELHPSLELPFIAPLPTGGVQLEWSNRVLEVTVEFTLGGQAQCRAHELESNELMESELGPSREPLFQIINKLVTRPTQVLVS